MEVTGRNGSVYFIDSYIHNDFEEIQKLNKNEGWDTLAKNRKKTKTAWDNSSIAFTVKTQGNDLVGYVRGHTDTAVSLFICELLIDVNYRGLGLGTKLLQFVHALYPETRVELLATRDSRAYYENAGYRPFYGFRKTYDE